MPEGYAAAAGRPLLPEEMILLLAACAVPASRRMRCAVGAAGLAELLIVGRVRIEGWSRFGVQMKRFAIIDRRPVGDQAVDALVQSYADLPNRSRLLYYEIPKIGDHFLRECGDRLVARGAIDYGVGKRGKPPFVIRDASSAARVRTRVAGVLLNNAAPDARAVALAAVVHGAGLTGCAIPAGDVKRATHTGRRLLADTAAGASMLGPLDSDAVQAMLKLYKLTYNLAESVGLTGDGGDGDGDGGEGGG